MKTRILQFLPQIFLLIIFISQVPEVRVGVESEATFSFTNPLDMPLTDCFLTMEVSGSVRPRTIRIDRYNVSAVLHFNILIIKIVC